MQSELSPGIRGKSQNTIQNQPAGGATDSSSCLWFTQPFWTGMAVSPGASRVRDTGLYPVSLPEGAGGLSALYLPWGQRHGAPEVKGGEGASNHTLKLESCVERLWGIQDDTILKKYLHTVQELTILWTRANLYHTEINKAPHHCSGVGLTSLFMLSLTRSLILVKQITL